MEIPDWARPPVWVPEPVEGNNQRRPRPVQLQGNLEELREEAKYLFRNERRWTTAEEEVILKAAADKWLRTEKRSETKKSIELETTETLKRIDPYWSRRKVRQWMSNYKGTAAVNNEFGWKAKPVKDPRRYFKDLDSGLMNVFEELKREGRMPKGRLKEISQETGVPLPTLYTWRHHLLQDKDYELYKGKNEHRLNLSRPSERELADKMRVEIAKHEFFPASCVREMATEIWRRDNPPPATPEEAVQIVPSFQYDWMKRFFKENRFSLRVAGLSHGTVVDDHRMAEFVQDMGEKLQVLDNDKVVNADETCWRIINGKLGKTVAVTGANSVKIAAEFSEKTSVTAMAAITASGRKLPLWIICKGKTEGSVKKFREIRLLSEAMGDNWSGDLIIKYSESGWMTEKLALEYLDWLHFKMGAHTLLWDVYPTHRTPAVKAKAAALKVHLEFVPAGATGELQPLDHGVFAGLKASARAMLAEAMKAKQDRLNLQWAAVCLKMCWDKFSEQSVKHAWDMLKWPDPEDSNSNPTT
jgi:hypothetical protein